MSGNDIESFHHFLLVSPKYVEQRQILVHAVENVNEILSTSYNVYISLNNFDELFALFLGGYNVPYLKNSINYNLLLFTAISRFILLSGRITNDNFTVLFVHIEPFSLIIFFCVLV